MSVKPLTPFQLARQRKHRAWYMSRSRSAFKLMNSRAKHNFTLETFRRIVQAAIDKMCPYCKNYITAKTFSPDHRVPLSRGGRPTLGNIQIICLKCNHAKGALTEVEFTTLIALLRTMDPIAINDILGRLRLGAAAKARWGRRWKR